jgi:hypothetical protein
MEVITVPFKTPNKHLPGGAEGNLKNQSQRAVKNIPHR